MWRAKYFFEPLQSKGSIFRKIQPDTPDQKSPKRPKIGEKGSSKARLPECSVKTCPKVDDPTQKKKPENTGKNKEEDGREKATLDELPETGNEKARERGNNIACGSLSVVHGCRIARGHSAVQPGFDGMPIKRRSTFQILVFRLFLLPCRFSSHRLISIWPSIMYRSSGSPSPASLF